MSWQITKRVWDSTSHLKTTEKLMLLALAEHADELGVCWPAYDTLARMTGLNRRSTIRVVAALETNGAIWVRPGAGRGCSNHYLVAAGLDQEQIAHILHTHPALRLALPAALTAAAVVSHRQPGPAKGGSHNTVYAAGAEEKVSFPAGNGVIPDQNGAGSDTLFPVEKVLSVTKNDLAATLNGVKSGPNGVSGNTRTIEPSRNQKELLISGSTQTGSTSTSPTSTGSSPAGPAQIKLAQTDLTSASPAQTGSSPAGPTQARLTQTGPALAGSALTDPGPTVPTPPPPAGKRAAPAASRTSAYQPLVEALAAACRYDLDLISRAERAELERDARKMAELGYSPADLEGFGRWWYQSDWRGKQNQAPSLKNVRTMLSQFKQKGTPNAQISSARPTRAAGLGQWSPDELAGLRGPAGRA